MRQLACLNARIQIGGQTHRGRGQNRAVGIRCDNGNSTEDTNSKKVLVFSIWRHERDDAR